MIRVPVLTYDNADFPVAGDSALFHYTKAENFWLIIENMSLRPSLFPKANDLNEANLIDYDIRDARLMIQAEKYIDQQCAYLSFAQNYSYQGYSQRGTNHPSMWAYYSDDTNGVCVVLEQKAFELENKNVLTKNYIFDNVEYDFINASNRRFISSDISNAKELVLKNVKELIFTKHIDWQHENERRLFIYDYDTNKREHLGIEKSIKYISFGQRFWQNKKNIIKLLEYVTDPSKKCYYKFIPHSFEMAMVGSTGYFLSDAAFIIMEQLWYLEKGKDGERYKQYHMWLKDNFHYE